MRESGNDVRGRATGPLESALATVDAEASEADAQAYRQLVLTRRRDRRGRRPLGRLRGIDGTPVNERAQAVLDELRSLLGVSLA